MLLCLHYAPNQPLSLVPNAVCRILRIVPSNAAMIYLIYLAAAAAEIAGCFAFWAWLRLDRSPLWLLPGIASLCVFAWLLTLVDAEHAGRAYAAYGGI